MCEMLAVAAPEPVFLLDLMGWARLLDELGIAGFGWGVAWEDGGRVRRYRCADGIRRDERARQVLAGARSRRVLFHLRRPSLMSSVSLPNSQPYLDPGQGWAFAHNGYLERHREHRGAFADRLEGTSDSEVGFHLWLSRLEAGDGPGDALAQVHRTLGGGANLMALSAGGRLVAYAGNPENRCLQLRVDGLAMVTTTLHSPDGFVLDAVFAQARDAREMALGEALELADAGAALPG